MQQMKTRGAMARRLMAFILVTFFAVGPAFGQTGQAVRAEIPYEFTFGSKVLPAGTYTFSVDRLWAPSAIGHRRGVSRAHHHSARRADRISSGRLSCIRQNGWRPHPLRSMDARDGWNTFAQHARKTTVTTSY